MYYTVLTRRQTTEKSKCPRLSLATTNLKCLLRPTPRRSDGSAGRAQPMPEGRRTDRRPEAPRSAFRRTNCGDRRRLDGRERASGRSSSRSPTTGENKERKRARKMRLTRCRFHCYCVQIDEIGVYFFGIYLVKNGKLAKGHFADHPSS